MRRDGKKIVNGWMGKGEVEAETPARWRYPSVYEVNGTSFEEAGDGVFRSEDGRVLDVRTT